VLTIQPLDSTISKPRIAGNLFVKVAQNVFCALDRTVNLETQARVVF